MSHSHSAKQTPLYQQHLDSGGKMVDFSGWYLPVNYGSQLKEHEVVRQAAGLFDVSHMTIVDITGPSVVPFLRTLLANDVTSLLRESEAPTPRTQAGAQTHGRSPAPALYTCMLNEKGGILDDLIVYCLGDDRFRLILNAATRQKDIEWIEQQISSFSAGGSGSDSGGSSGGSSGDSSGGSLVGQSDGEDITLSEQSDLALLAVQGPRAVEHIAGLFDADIAPAVSGLSRFSAREIGDWFIARTGYTGEDGFELALPASEAPLVWEKLTASGVIPCGLGARDTLRLEAALNLYGSDMDEAVSPLECNLGWTVRWQPDDRDFIGKASLLAQKSANNYRVQTGLQLEGRGVLRAGQVVFDDDREIGIVTSGTFSPTLQRSIAMARLIAVPDTRCSVDIRGKKIAASVVTLPFYRPT